VNETMIKKNVAELLVDVLVVAGVQRIYGVAGDSLNGITDTLRQREQIPWVGVRHGSARLGYCHSRKAVE
jgi:pyruvate dehydrogenase (quinone)